jgi:hypothetical protein
MKDSLSYFHRFRFGFHLLLQAKAAFKRFSEKVSEVDELIQARNEDPRLKNRKGVVQMPYQLMRPNSTPGVTFRGVPNSISI